MNPLQSCIAEIKLRTDKAPPQIYKACAHPQAVWFEEHWRPMINEADAFGDEYAETKIVRRTLAEISKLAEGEK